MVLPYQMQYAIPMPHSMSRFDRACGRDYSPNDSDSPCCCRPLVEEFTFLRDLVGLLVGLRTTLARRALPLWSWWESPWVGSCGVCRRCHCRGRDHKVAASASIRCGWCGSFFGSGFMVVVLGRWALEPVVCRFLFGLLWRQITVCDNIQKWDRPLLSL